MTTFVDRLDGLREESCVIPWGCPVPFFGDLSSAVVATVGINPSNREFVDYAGRALDEEERRLPTLRSLGVQRWSDVDASHVREIIYACTEYFERNPYDRWFRTLQRILEPSGLTFYGSRPTSCHIDLVPFATEDKWGTLALSDRKDLLRNSGDALGHLLRDSSLNLLVLNGQSVVDHFEVLTNSNLLRTEMKQWDLPRKDALPVKGYAYGGEIREVGGVSLGRSIRVVGYNHNLQSSFGVTSGVMSNIGTWLRSSNDPVKD
jgi:hypothetical protein